MGMGLKLDRLFTMLNPAPTYTDNKLVPQISARCLLGTLCEHPKACALRFCLRKPSHLSNTIGDPASAITGQFLPTIRIGLLDSAYKITTEVTDVDITTQCWRNLAIGERRNRLEVYDALVRLSGREVWWSSAGAVRPSGDVQLLRDVIISSGH